MTKLKRQTYKIRAFFKILISLQLFLSSSHLMAQDTQACVDEDLKAKIREFILEQEIEILEKETAIKTLKARLDTYMEDEQVEIYQLLVAVPVMAASGGLLLGQKESIKREGLKTLVKDKNYMFYIAVFAAVFGTSVYFMQDAIWDLRLSKEEMQQLYKQLKEAQDEVEFKKLSISALKEEHQL